MKNVLLCTAILLLAGLMLGACSSSKAQERETFAVNVKVIDKGEGDNGQYWIMTAYPDKKKLKSVDKIILEESVWDTVQIDHKYTVRYSRQEDGTYIFSAITPLKD
ncbi:MULTISPECIES: hypothetical protein [unclassified Paenibacillus]|uniref:hypothetical protein n=1 Tax=unclassified Paenibacillus TaxID=185978 RepID=UPI00104A5414|nr:MULTISPECIES: hypothetical protein [unclassified Paenibacillus]NIK71333.1 hypothetical protein [Paenibacillus sp. BK720]TCM96950.1 hypothetical protein EV294_104161 [Paenibacillus sp. BK033]